MTEAGLVGLTIDGKEVRAREGTLLIHAAREAGIDVPSLCWLPKLTPTGACRLSVEDRGGARAHDLLLHARA